MLGRRRRRATRPALQPQRHGRRRRSAHGRRRGGRRSAKRVRGPGIELGQPLARARARSARRAPSGRPGTRPGRSRAPATSRRLTIAARRCRAPARGQQRALGQQRVAVALQRARVAQAPGATDRSSARSAPARPAPARAPLRPPRRSPSDADRQARASDRGRERPPPAPTCHHGVTTTASLGGLGLAVADDAEIAGGRRRRGPDRRADGARLLLRGVTSTGPGSSPAVVAWALVILAAWSRRARCRSSTAGRVALAGLALLCVWTAALDLWAPIGGRAQDDLQRLLLYLGFFIAALALLRGAERAPLARAALVARRAVVVVATGCPSGCCPT